MGDIATISAALSRCSILLLGVPRHRVVDFPELTETEKKFIDHEQGIAGTKEINSIRQLRTEEAAGRRAERDRDRDHSPLRSASASPKPKYVKSSQSQSHHGHNKPKTPPRSPSKSPSPLKSASGQLVCRYGEDCWRKDPDHVRKYHS